MRWTVQVNGSFAPHGYSEAQVPSSFCSADLPVLKIICMMEAGSPSRADSICREEEERLEKAPWDVFCSPDPEVVHFIFTHAIGDNVATWPQLTARDAGKCSPSLSSHVPAYSSLIIEEWFSTNNWSSELESSEEPSLFPTSLGDIPSCKQCGPQQLSQYFLTTQLFPSPCSQEDYEHSGCCSVSSCLAFARQHILSKSMEDQLLNLQGSVQNKNVGSPVPKGFEF